MLAHGESTSSTSLVPGLLPGLVPLLLALMGAVVLVGLLRRRSAEAPGRAGALTRGAARVGRGLLVAAASLGMSLSGHVLAGAPPAPTAELVAATGVLAVVCCVASRVRWTGRRLLAATGTAEPCFHVLFEMGAVDGGAGLRAATAATGLLTDPAMLAGHAAAAVALAAVLARGEALAFDVVAVLAAAVARWIVPLGPGSVPPRPAGHSSSDVRPAPRPSSVLLVSAPRRGPPQGVSAG